MEGDELRELARRAANYTGYRSILVLGSQAVHGSLPDVPLPPLTTASEEADLAVPSPAADDDVAHAIEAQFGMGSPYHQHFGVYADGISLSEVALPDGWEGRLRTEQIDDDGPDNPVTLLFPEIHDLCASKLTVAVTGGFGRRADRAFIEALVDAGQVDLDLLAARVRQLPQSVADEVREQALQIVDRLRSSPAS